MSAGMICLSCRKYIGDLEWHCRCADPVPSLDGERPHPDYRDAADEQDDADLESYLEDR